MSKKSTEAAEAAPTEGAGFPLFFQKPAPLELKRHAKAGISPTQDYSFARSSNSLLINAIEFVEAAKHYPIVFTHGEIPMPAVILGLENENYFIDKKGQWKEETYIPAYVRKYPFVFMDASAQKQFLLCVDEAAPQFKKAGGKNTLPLYEDGKPSKLAINALEFCTSYHNHYIMTLRFCEALREADILVPSQSNTKLANGRKINLGRFKVIDEKKLNTLPNEKILELHRKGWLSLIYFALMAGSHWKRLAAIIAKREEGK